MVSEGKLGKWLTCKILGFKFLTIGFMIFVIKMCLKINKASYICCLWWLNFSKQDIALKAFIGKKKYKIVTLKDLVCLWAVFYLLNFEFFSTKSKERHEGGFPLLNPSLFRLRFFSTSKNFLIVLIKRPLYFRSRY